MAYVYAASTVCVTIFSTGGKFRSVSKFYRVACSYSSCPFLCALVPTEASSKLGAISYEARWTAAFVHVAYVALAVTIVI